jgi:hypothetical protein
MVNQFTSTFLTLFCLGFVWCYRCGGGQSAATRASPRMRDLSLDFSTMNKNKIDYTLLVSSNFTIVRCKTPIRHTYDTYKGEKHLLSALILNE